MDVFALDLQLSKYLESTDLLALLVTSAVFLAGFSSLRVHATMSDKRRRIDEVVSSVTTTPGYAAALRRLSDEVALAASTSDWKGAARHLDEVAAGSEQALTDRDLQPAAEQFRVTPLGQVDRVARLTLGMVALFTGLIAIGWLLAPYAPGPLLWGDVLVTSVALVAAVAVLLVACSDFLHLAREYKDLSRALSLTGISVTAWRPEPPVEDAGWDAGPDLDHAWARARGYLRLGSDTLIPMAPAGDDHRSHNARGDADLVPEWSSPWQRAAFSGWSRSRFLATRVERHHAPGPEDAEVSRRRFAALADAFMATRLNPLDPGCRLMLAALMIDDLGAQVADGLRSAPGGGDIRRIGHLSEPLALSDTNSADPSGDPTRPQRWRISAALRSAREASILVEAQQFRIVGRRAAAGAVTGLDRIGVDYQLARAYVLSAANAPDSGLGHNNAGSAADLLDGVKASLDALAKWDPQARTHTGWRCTYTFQPMVLGLTLVTEGGTPGQWPIGPVEAAELDWWRSRARWLMERRASGAGTETSVDLFVDLWGEGAEAWAQADARRR